jgi:cell division protein ZapA (FtsZ GTPase activity inhibitor)
VDKRVVDITLHGQHFVLKSSQDEESLNKIVQFANSRIDGIASAAGALSPHKVALLAVLDLAEELVEERRNLTDLKEKIRTKSNLLLDMLEGTRQSSVAGSSSGDNPPGEG